MRNRVDCQRGSNVRRRHVGARLSCSRHQVVRLSRCCRCRRRRRRIACTCRNGHDVVSSVSFLSQLSLQRCWGYVVRPRHAESAIVRVCLWAMAKGCGVVLQRAAGRARIALWRGVLPEETDFQNQNNPFLHVFFSPFSTFRSSLSLLFSCLAV
jgi:hypothetical protein